MISILGAPVTSYSKARAESLDVKSRSIGLMGRVTRGVSLLIGLLYLPIPPIILWILAIFQISPLCDVFCTTVTSRSAALMKFSRPIIDLWRCLTFFRKSSHPNRNHDFSYESPLLGPRCSSRTHPSLSKCLFGHYERIGDSS